MKVANRGGWSMVNLVPGILTCHQHKPYSHPPSRVPQLSGPRPFAQACLICALPWITCEARWYSNPSFPAKRMGESSGYCAGFYFCFLTKRWWQHQQGL